VELFIKFLCSSCYSVRNPYFWAMATFYKLQKEPKKTDDVNRSEIRVTAAGKIRNYISYAIHLFKDAKLTEICLKAMGRVTHKAVLVAELLRGRVPDLHQQVEISSVPVADRFQPSLEGLDTVIVERNISSIAIRLSVSALDISHVGYHPPLKSRVVARKRGRRRNFHSRRGGRVSVKNSLQ